MSMESKQMHYRKEIERDEKTGYKVHLIWDIMKTGQKYIWYWILKIIKSTPDVGYNENLVKVHLILDIKNCQKYTWYGI